MKKIAILFVLFTSFNKGFSQQLNDPNAQVRVAGNFNSLKVSQAFEVYLSQGGEESLAVSAKDKKYLSQIKTEVKDGELHVWHDGGNIHDWNTAKMKLKIYLSFVSLDKIKVDQGCHVYAVGNWKDEELKKKLLADVNN